MFSFPNLLSKWLRMKSLTSLQTLEPSKLPIVTSNKLLLSFLIHGFSLLKSKDFLACLIIEISFEILAKLEAQHNAWSKSFSKMDG